MTTPPAPRRPFEQPPAGPQAPPGPTGPGATMQPPAGAFGRPPLVDVPAAAPSKKGIRAPWWALLGLFLVGLLFGQAGAKGATAPATTTTATVSSTATITATTTTTATVRSTTTATATSTVSVTVAPTTQAASTASVLPFADATTAAAPAPATVAAPLYIGQPGYRPGLDADGDGKACEVRPR